MPSFLLYAHSLGVIIFFLSVTLPLLLLLFLLFLLLLLLLQSMHMYTYPIFLSVPIYCTDWKLLMKLLIPEHSCRLNSNLCLWKAENLDYSSQSGGRRGRGRRNVLDACSEYQSPISRPIFSTSQRMALTTSCSIAELKHCWSRFVFARMWDHGLTPVVFLLKCFQSQIKTEWNAIYRAASRQCAYI